MTRRPRPAPRLPRRPAPRDHRARARRQPRRHACPLPFLDDWAVGAILGGGYRRIAAAHQRRPRRRRGQRTSSTARASRRRSPTSRSSGCIARVAARAAQRMMVALATINRARSAARTFTAMTLFDHYCAKLHTGLALDGADRARAARGDRPLDRPDARRARVPSVPPRRARRRARDAARAARARRPRARGGRLRKLLAAKTRGVTEAEHVDDVEQAMDAALADKTNFLSRTVAAVEVAAVERGQPVPRRARSSRSIGAGVRAWRPGPSSDDREPRASSLARASASS